MLHPSTSDPMLTSLPPPDPNWPATGALYREPDVRDWNLEHAPGVQAQLLAGLPNDFYRLPLESVPSHIKINQGSVPKCVASTKAHVKSFHEFEEGGQWLPFDDDELYRACGGTGSNGIPTQASLDYLKTIGGLERGSSKRWKIDSYLFAPQAYRQFRETLGAALMADGPCCIALLLPERFGWISGGRKTAGYHEMEFVGWEGLADDGWAVFLNSWGEGFGQRGYVRIPWNFMEEGGSFQNRYCYAYRIRDAQESIPTPTPTPTPTPEPVAEILRLTNEARRLAGLQPLLLNAALTQAAQGHAEHMARSNTFGHDGIGDGTPLDRIVAAGYTNPAVWGENIAAGQTDPSGPANNPWAGMVSAERNGEWLARGISPMGAFTDWLNSPSHKANILFPGFREIGIAHVNRPGSQYVSYWVQNFGDRQGSPTPTPTPIPTPTPTPQPDELQIQSVAGTRQLAAARLNEAFTVIGRGFGSGVIRAQIGGADCGVTVVDDRTLKVTAPRAPLVGALSVRREGAVVAGPVVAVLLNGDGPVPTPTPAPAPEPQPGELMVEAQVAVVGAARLLIVTVHDHAGQPVTAAVNAEVGGVNRGTLPTKLLGGRVLPAQWVLREAVGTPIVVTARAADGRQGRRELVVG